MSDYIEDHLVEQPAVQLMQHELGWDVVNCYGEWDGGVSVLGRDGKREVVLVSRLRLALHRLNPDLPVEAIEGAVEEICRDRTALSLVEANREIDKLLKQWVKVSFPDQEHGGQRVELVSVLDWEVPENNDFLLGSQFWVAGELYLKRPDLVGFVNGLPLVRIELKKPGVNVREGFDKNIHDYKQTIPQLFHFNVLLIVSNGGVNRAVNALLRTLTPALSQGEGELSHYRGGFQVAGMVARARELRERQTPAEKVLWDLLRDRQIAGV